MPQLQTKEKPLPRNMDSLFSAGGRHDRVVKFVEDPNLSSNMCHRMALQTAHPSSVAPTGAPGALRAEPLELPLVYTARANPEGRATLVEELLAFREFGKATKQLTTSLPSPGHQPRQVPMFVNEFWTAKQRQAHSLHEISYRACFKPQLPRFFIERLTQPGDSVYD